MNDDNLVIGLGVDLSAYNTALKSAEASFNNMVTKFNSGSNQIKMGLDLKSYASQLKKAEKEWATTRTKLEENAVKLKVNLDSKELDLLATKLQKANAQALTDSEKKQKAIDDAQLKRKIKNYKRAKTSLDKTADEADAYQKKLEDTQLKRKIANYKRTKMHADLASKETDELQKKVEDAQLKRKINNLKRANAKEKELNATADARRVKAEALLLKRKIANYKRARAREVSNAKFVSKVRQANIDILMTKFKKSSDRRKLVELRRIKALTQAELAARAKIEKARLAKSPTANPWGNIEKVSHAIKTTALYGATAQVLFGLQNAFRGAVEEAIRFDQSIAQINAVLQITGESAVVLAENVTALGIRFGTDFTDIQEGMITLGRAGVDSATQLKKGMDGLAALSIITGDAMHYGAAAMASMISVYPELASKMGDLSNKMGAVANATRLGLEDFSTINNYALTTAKNVGLSADAYAALNGALSKVGLNASTIGTSIRRLDKFTLDSAASVQNFFRVAGTSQKAFADGLRNDSTKELTDFTKTLAAMTDSQFSYAIADLNIQMRATAVSMRAIGRSADGQGGASVFENMTETVTNASDVMKQADKNAVGLDRALKSISNVIKSTFNETLQNTIKGVLDTENIKVFTESLKDLMDILKRVAGVAISFGSALLIAKAVGVAVTAFGTLALAVTSLEAALLVTVTAANAARAALLRFIPVAVLVGTLEVFKQYNKEVKKAGQTKTLITLSRYTADYAKQKDIVKALNEELARLNSQWDIAKYFNSDAIEALNKHIDIATKRLHDLTPIAETTSRGLAELYAGNPDANSRGLEHIVAGYVDVQGIIAATHEMTKIDYANQDKINTLIAQREGTYSKHLHLQEEAVNIRKEIIRLENEDIASKGGTDNTTAILKLKVKEQEKLIQLKKYTEQVDEKTKDIATKLFEAQAKQTLEAKKYLVISGVISKEKEKELIAKAKLEQADAKTIQVLNELVALQAVKGKGQEHLNKIAEKEAELQKAVADEMSKANDHAIALEASAKAVRDRISQAATQARSLATALAKAVLALESALRGQAVLGGAMNIASKEAQDRADALLIATKEHNDELSNEKQLRAEINSGAYSATEVAKKELELAALKTVILGKHKTLIDLQNADTKALNTLNREGYAIAAKLNATEIKKLYAQTKNMTKQEVRINTAKKEYALALNTLKVAKEKASVSDHGNAFDLEGLAVAKATAAVAEKKQKLADSYLKTTEKAGKAARLADKYAKEEMKRNEELMKQEVLRYKIKVEQGKISFGFQSKSLAIYKKEAKEAAKLVKANEKLVKGAKSDVQLQKDKTHSLQTQYNLLVKMTAEMNKWTNVFDSIFSGDLAGAINTAFADVFEGFQKSVAEMAGGADSLIGSVMGGLTGSLIGMGVEMLSGMLSSTVSQAELDAAEGITDVQSESIVNSLAMLEEYESVTVGYSQDMMYSLRTLVALTDTAAANIGTTYSGDEYAAKSSEIFGGIWGSSSTELLATGIKLDPATIAELTAGQLTGNAYMKELVSKSSFFGLISSEKVRTTDLGALDSGVLDPITEAYLQGLESIQLATEAFGISIQDFDSIAASWVTTMSELNFEGKSAEEISDMITGVISKDLDTWVSSIASVAPYIEEFAKAGEYAHETLIRLISDYERVSYAFDTMGMDMNDITMGGLRMAEALADAAGGMDNFIDKLSYFVENFFTDAEKIGFQTEILQAAYAKLNITMPTTIAGMKALVNGRIAEIASMSSQIDAQVFKAETDIALARATYEAGSANLLYAESMYVTATLAIEASKLLLEASAQNLDTILGTLPMWTDVYGTAEDASTALDRLYASLVDIASLQAEWMSSDVAGAELVLNAVRNETELFGVTIDNFLSSFNAALNADGTMLNDDFDNWTELSSALKSLEAAQQAELELALASLNAEVAFYDEILRTIQDAYLGSLSYLNSIEKVDYAGQQADLANAEGDTQSYLDLLEKQLANEMAISTTREDYSLDFEAYIKALGDAEYEPEATTDDVVDQLEIANEKLDELAVAIQKASYQA